MPTTAENEFTTRAARLARAAPREWEDFLGAFTHYANEQATNCIMSPPEELPSRQGRAQASLRILELLANCLKGDDKTKRN